MGSNKKYLSIFLSFIFVFVSVFPISAQENISSKNNRSKNNKSQSMEFYKKSSELIKKNWNEDYFKSIKLKVGKNYLINDNNKKVKLSSKVYMENDKIMVPVNEMINLSGGKINKENKNIQINYLGNNVELKEGSEKIEVNDKDKSISSKVTVNDENVIVPIDVLSKGLGYTYKYDKKSKEIEIESPYQTMRLIVKLKNSNTDLSKYKSAESIKGLNNISVLQFKSIEDTKSACEQIKKDNIAVYVEPDYYISDQSTKSVSKNSKSSAYNSWGVQYMEADKYANYLNKQNLKNSITVGVVDSGIDYEHPYFKNRISNGGYDFVNSDYDPYDDYFHGTHVSGTIVDCTPGLNVNILPVKVLGYDGRGTGLNTANGIEYAANCGVDVINFSIAMDSHWDYIHEIIENAISKNVVVVLSAGNDSNNTYYECPSDMYNPVVVSAMNSYGEKCSFSNYGNTIDVAAPGEDVYSAYPGGGYYYLDGTSMAAPHISAVCAMYRLKYPNLNVYQIEDLLHKNTKDLGAKGWDEYFGYGVPHLSLAIPSNEKPVISGVSNKTIKVGESFNPRAGVRATDKEDGDITSKIKISGSVNTAKVGKYTLTYSVVDSDNNKVSKSAVITVKVPSTTLKATSSSYKSIKLTWSKLSGINGYQIYRATSKTGKYSLIKTITSSTTSSYINTSLTTGKTYYYKIRAYKVLNSKKVYGSYSSVVSAKPSLSKPSLTLSVGIKKAYIKWNKISGASGYEIYRATSKSGTYSKIKTVTSSSTTSYTNSKLTSKKTYYYKLRAYKNVSGKKVYSSYSTIKYIKIK